MPERFEEDDFDPYCEKCGACGEDGCCPKDMCYSINPREVPDDKKDAECAYKDAYIHDLKMAEQLYKETWYLLDFIEETTEDPRTIMAIKQWRNGGNGRYYP